MNDPISKDPRSLNAPYAIVQPKVNGTYSVLSEIDHKANATFLPTRNPAKIMQFANVDSALHAIGMLATGNDYKDLRVAGLDVENGDLQVLPGYQTRRPEPANLFHGLAGALADRHEVTWLEAIDFLEATYGDEVAFFDDIRVDSLIDYFDDPEYFSDLSPTEPKSGSLYHAAISLLAERHGTSFAEAHASVKSRVTEKQFMSGDFVEVIVDQIENPGYTE